MLCSILAAFAALAGTAPKDSEFLKIFYILPSVYFLSLYNVIKYTGTQMQLGAYRQILEEELNQYLTKDFLLWESTVTEGPKYVIWGGAVQFLFDIPISLFILWGFWELESTFMWWIMAPFILAQVVSILIMVWRLLYAKETARIQFESRIKKS